MADHREWRFVGLWTLAILILTYSPYLVGNIKPVPGYVFDGYLVFEEDMNSYLSYIRQSARGKWLFQNQFTSEDHSDVFLNLEWLVFGKLSGLLKAPLATAFQIERAVGGIVLIVGFYLFSTMFIQSRFLRRIALVIFSLGGGFGWLWALFRTFWGVELPFAPLDLTTGLHPFFQIMLNPHFSIAHGTLLLTLSMYLMAEMKCDRKYYVGSGIACAMLGLMRPFDMLVLVFTALIFIGVLCIRRQERSLDRVLWRSLMIVIPGPVMVYYVFLFWWHPVYKWWYAQNVASGIPLLGGILSIGLVLFAALWGLGRLFDRRETKREELCLLAFVAAAYLLTFSRPVFKFAVQFGSVAISPLIVIGLLKLEEWRWFRPSIVKVLALSALVGVNSLTSVWLVKSKIDEVGWGMHQIDERVVAAFRWLEETSSPSDVVLASCATGNKIPRYSGNKVFCGYIFSTVDHPQKLDLVRRFFDSDTPDEARLDLLRRYRIRYLFYGPVESTLGKYHPEASAFLRVAYRNEIVTIFAVDSTRAQVEAIQREKRVVRLDGQVARLIADDEVERTIRVQKLLE